MHEHRHVQAQADRLMSCFDVGSLIIKAYASCVIESVCACLSDCVCLPAPPSLSHS